MGVGVHSQGHPVAEYELGLCYSNGEGVKQDLKQAALLYQREIRLCSASSSRMHSLFTVPG